MNNAKKVFTIALITLIACISSTVSAARSAQQTRQITQKLSALDAQLSAINTQSLSTGIPQDAKNAQIKDSLERIKSVVKELIKQQQEIIASE